MTTCSKNKFNLLMEFSDRELERDFFQQEMHDSLRFLKPIILVLGILNTLFMIPDYFFAENEKKYILIAIIRLVVLIFVIGLFVSVKYLKNFSLMAYWITAIEISFVLQFLFIFYQYKSPNFLIQAYGVMVIILGVFMVPNRCIFKFAVSLFVSISFLVLSGHHITNIKLSEFSAGIAYIGIVFILSCIISVNNDFNKRIQYVNRLELVRLSDTDYLTGVYNRSKLDQELKHWVEYSKRYSLPLSLIILDFDDFKAVNDTYGHLAGDSVIRETVDLINKSIRKSDVFARWGGEEFLVVLPNTDKFQAAEMAERFRRKIENHKFEKANSMTCSFGVVQLQSDEGIETLFQRADRILYEAKKAGKNKVIS